MTSKRFPFLVYAGDNPSPSLELELLGVNGHVEATKALVDSGTEWTQMPLELGMRLGVDLSLCHSVMSQTGGGLTKGDRWWNRTPEGLVREEPAVRVMGHEAPIAPILSAHISIVALGREDFLSSFKFSIDQRERSFMLELYDESVGDWQRRTGRV